MPPATEAPSATSHPELDGALRDLAASAPRWAALGPGARADLLARVRRDTVAAAGDLVAAVVAATGEPMGGDVEAEVWITGVFPTLRVVRLLERSLRALDRGEAPLPGSRVQPRAGGGSTAAVFPIEPWDRVLWAGLSGEVWLDDAPEPAAGGPGPTGGVAVVLGAGNVASIGPNDALEQLVARDRTVLLKLSPVLDGARPAYERMLRALVEPGFVRIVDDGPGVGPFLVGHPGVDAVHVTGGVATYGAVLAERAESGGATVTAELGNVTPVIVVPGPWSDRDLAYQARHLTTLLASNAACNCVTPRVLVTPRRWDRRADLLAALRTALAATPTRRAYYPGAADRHERFLAAHPDAEQLGARRPGDLPWTLVADLDPGASADPCFTTEPFCPFVAETALDAPTPADFLAAAVALCNERIWGTLAVTLLVHPDSLAEPATRAAVEEAIADLRYGTVGVNVWAGVGFALGVTPWGAAPGSTPADPQSGTGWVHGTLLLDHAAQGRPARVPVKSVLRGSFRELPTPPWFVGSRRALSVARALTRFEADPSWWRVPGVVAQAVV